MLNHIVILARPHEVGPQSLKRLLVVRDDRLLLHVTSRDQLRVLKLHVVLREQFGILTHLLVVCFFETFRLGDGRVDALLDYIQLGDYGLDLLALRIIDGVRNLLIVHFYYIF